MPQKHFTLLAPDLFLYEDGIRVYVLRRESRGILIDFASGGVLDHLSEIGVGCVTHVLVTHGHRTQVEGIGRLVGSATAVHVNPEATVFKADAMESCLAELVPMRTKAVGRFELPPPLPEGLNLRADLKPGASITLDEADFQVLPAPGHDPEQVALVTTIDGTRVCFAGDAIHSPGKIYEVFSTDTDHYTATGARAAAAALAGIRATDPDLVLPSHGPGLHADVAAGLSLTEHLMRGLSEYKEHFFFGQPRARELKDECERPFGEDGPCHMSEHIWHLFGNTYAITTDEDPEAALLVDVSVGAIAPVKEALACLGLTRPEAILATHYHLDHLPSASDRKELPDTELWAQEAVARIAEGCEAFRRPWLHDGPVPVDRHFADGETFRWHEHTFTAHFMPGQTDGHAGYSARIDGRLVLFSGDNFSHPQVWGGCGGLCGFNGAWDPLTGYAYSVQRVLDLAPDWLLCEHRMAMAYDRGAFEYALQWCRDVATLQTLLSPDGDRARHWNPYLISFEPFVQAPPTARKSVVRCVLDNRGSDRARQARLTCERCDGIEVSPRELSLAAAAGEVEAATFELVVTKSQALGNPLTVVPFQVEIDGERCGAPNAIFLDRRLES